MSFALTLKTIIFIYYFILIYKSKYKRKYKKYTKINTHNYKLKQGHSQDGNFSEAKKSAATRISETGPKRVGWGLKRGLAPSPSGARSLIDPNNIFNLTNSKR